MNKPPPKPAPWPGFVNLRGEPIDPRTLRRSPATAPLTPPTPPNATDEAAEASATLTAADLDTVDDALCLAGCARHRTWLMHFLRALGRKTRGNTSFTTAEVGAALHALRVDGRVVDADGIGFDIPPARRLERLPALLLDAGNADAWRAWAQASASYRSDLPLPPMPSYRHGHELIALARLALAAGMDLAAWRQAAARSLGIAAGPEPVAEALTTPFVPELFSRMKADLRQHLVLTLMHEFNLFAPPWQPLMDWLDERLRQKPDEVPPALRLQLAERRLNRGDLAGSEAALSGLASSAVPLMRAAQIAWSGRWADAVQAFAPALKAALKAATSKRGVLPPGLLQWYLLSLLAQPDPKCWALVHKLCITEAGMRQPPVDDRWGLWAHAAAVRLGDAALVPEAFAWPTKVPVYLPAQADTMAHRLLLAAWLGHTPDGWTASATQSLAQALHAGGKAWKADLVRQACQRLQWPVPDRAVDEAPPWPASFYGSPHEAWRDALAVIESLGPTTAAEAAGLPPATLRWQLKLDAEGRVIDVEPFERAAGVRGPGKPRAITLAKVKKSARLDPRDAAVARCIDGARWSPSQLAIDVVGATLALVGHPDLVLADAPAQRIDLREALPVLEVRRQQGDDGTEQFVFHLADDLLAMAPAQAGTRFTSTDASVESERRNGLRLRLDGPDSARLLRISPAQRRVAELVAKRWAVPVQAKTELDAALRVLAGHFQLHSDAAAGQSVDAESHLRAQLSPLGEHLQLRLLVQPFGSFGPTVAPGSGRARLMTVREGLSLSTERNLAAESAHLAEVLEALPFLAGSESSESAWLLDDPELALAVVEKLPRLAAVAGVDWPRGKPVRVTPVAADAVKASVSSGADWFAVAGEVRIDEQRVLSLQQLLKLAQGSRRSRFVALGDGEYLALTEQLRQQLADLQALARPDKGGGLELPAAAAAWLAETLDGIALKGDKPWARRLALLDEAAALTPEPPAALQAQLRGYQAEGFAWMARLAHAGLGACLADDMGLGKTVQTLALLLHRAAIGPALVIAPTSVCGNWVAEAQRFAPGLRVGLYGEGDRAALLDAAAPFDLVIASYSLAQIDAEAFARVEWATLVLDEAQALKNAATKRAKSVATLQAGFKLALTGTPVENRLADLWSIMNLLNPGLLGSSAQFGERFANAIEKTRDEGARGRLRRLVAPFLLRRTKAQVLTDLPPRTEIIHRIEPGPEERAFLEATRRSAVERVSELDDTLEEGQAAFHVLAELTRLRRAACDPRLVAPELGLVGAKVQEFETLASELVAGRHKALVFSQFTDFLKLLAERLQSAGIAYQYLDGSTPGPERSRRVAAFQRGEGELFLISLKAGGFGLNLTAADYVLIVDPWWNPAAEDQAMGRAHRIGQQRPVTVYRLVTAGSIEERIIELHRDKRSLADGILEGQDSAAPLRADDLRELLRNG